MANVANFTFSDKYTYYPTTRTNGNNGHFPNYTTTSTTTDLYPSYSSIVSTRGLQ
jgi:hypothetical protein